MCSIERSEPQFQSGDIPYKFDRWQDGLEPLARGPRDSNVRKLFSDTRKYRVDEYRSLKRARDGSWEGLRLNFIITQDDRFLSELSTVHQAVN